jgi:hypothetical protein
MTELAKLWLPLIGGGILIAWAIGAYYGGDKLLGVRLAFAGAVCLLILGELQWEESILSEAPAIQPIAPAIQERPELFFIFISHNLNYTVRGDPSAEKVSLIINYKIVNYGKSTAIIKTFDSGIEINKEVTGWNISSKMRDIVRVIPPGGEIIIAERGTVSQVEPEVRMALRMGIDLRAWLSGKITYTDTKGISYKLGFCFWADSFGRLNDGPDKYNYRD